MKTKKKFTFMKGVPSAIQAFLLALSIILLLFFLAAILGSISFFSENAGEQVAYIIHAILIAAGCYLICWQNPRSVWYVPVIANIFVIISAVVEPSFWISSLWIYFGSSIVLSVPASVLGAFKGRKILKSME